MSGRAFVAVAMLIISGSVGPTAEAAPMEVVVPSGCGLPAPRTSPAVALRWVNGHKGLSHGRAIGLGSPRRERASRLHTRVKVRMEDKRAARFAQLRRVQRLAAIAAGTAAFVMVLYLYSALADGGAAPGIFRRQAPQALVVLSAFLAAHPIEYGVLFWISSCASSACEAAHRVNQGGAFRGMYLALVLCGAASMFDGTALDAQASSVSSSSSLALAALFAYTCAAWLTSVCSFAEIYLGWRSLKENGLPSWPRMPQDKHEKPQGALLIKCPWLPVLYGVAQLLVILEMLRSSPWRASRLSLVAFALDKLRGLSQRPAGLGGPEAVELNRSVGIWACASLLESVTLGALTAGWARRLGALGIGAGLVGLFSTVATGLPAAVALIASSMGWSQAEFCLSCAARTRPSKSRRWRRLGRMSLAQCEELYAKSVGAFYGVNGKKEDRLDEVEYYRLKVWLREANSSALRMDRLEIRKRFSWAGPDEDEEKHSAPPETKQPRTAEQPLPFTSPPSLSLDLTSETDGGEVDGEADVKAPPPTNPDKG